MNAKKAAELIWECWQNGMVIKNIPNFLQIQTREEGYEIQSYFERYSNYPLFGWKIAATSLAGQNHIGVSGPLAGRILQERVFEPSTRLNFGTNRMAVAEAEFAFRIGSTLKPRTTEYSQEEVMSAVEALHPAIEIPDSRFHDFNLIGEALLIADNACAHEFVIGPPMPDTWRSVDLSKHSVTISIVDSDATTGVGSNVLGDPRIALTWLTNELSRNNISLIEGAIVATGTCTTPIKIRAGDTITAEYGVLGQIQTAFAADGQ
ncbi:MAG: ABC transporter permease [Magnetovibrio sp.]|nr:ABC transporter permease [Magnetovibrio sp.]|tara:strand:+ start:124 stop:912 length:789 start_codon:yes stop_codon:yes gene_type:complete